MSEPLRLVWTGRLVSVNQWTSATIGKNKSGRTIPIIYKTTKYKQFVSVIAENLMIAHARAGNTINAGSFLSVDIEVHTYKDIDSGIKPTLDAIESSGIVANDSQIHRLKVRKIPIKKNAIETLTIEISPC